VFAFEGRMVDSPVLKHAAMMLQRAGESAPQ
jgi:citrate lyase subunit beta/citryl-CoA lyase